MTLIVKSLLFFREPLFIVYFVHEKWPYHIQYILYYSPNKIFTLLLLLYYQFTVLLLKTGKTILQISGYITDGLHFWNCWSFWFNSCHFVPIISILYWYLHSSRNIYAMAAAGRAGASERFLYFRLFYWSHLLDFFHRVSYGRHFVSISIFS